MQAKIDTMWQLCMKLEGKRPLVYSAGQGRWRDQDRSGMGSEGRQQSSGQMTGVSAAIMRSAVRAP
jgi:hypothetical protein